MGSLIQGASRSPAAWMRDGVAPALSYLDMLLLDYGITRALYNNSHKISADAWRSAQPAPHHIGWFAARGVKTVINLRGEQSFGTRLLEERACARHKVRLVDLKLRSRAAPTREELFSMRDALKSVAFPILVHCKSGADRAGLMSVIVSHVRDGVPIEIARRQLGLRYGHFRQAETGVLDAVFDRYVAYNAKMPIEFWDWVARDYDPDEINKNFKAQGWANRLVNGVLRRE